MRDIGKIKSWQIVPLPEDRRCFAIYDGCFLCAADMYITVQVENNTYGDRFYSGYFDSSECDNGSYDICSCLYKRIKELTVDFILNIIYNRQEENCDDFIESIDYIRWVLSESGLSYSNEVRKFIFLSTYEEIKDVYFAMYGKDAPINEY